jgi:hypothetical protein
VPPLASVRRRRAGHRCPSDGRTKGSESPPGAGHARAVGDDSIWAWSSTWIVSRELPMDRKKGRNRGNLFREEVREPKAESQANSERFEYSSGEFEIFWHSGGFRLFT